MYKENRILSINLINIRRYLTRNNHEHELLLVILLNSVRNQVICLRYMTCIFYVNEQRIKKVN